MHRVKARNLLCRYTTFKVRVQREAPRTIKSMGMLVIKTANRLVRGRSRSLTGAERMRIGAKTVRLPKNRLPLPDAESVGSAVSSR